MEQGEETRLLNFRSGRSDDMGVTIMPWGNGGEYSRDIPQKDTDLNGHTPVNMLDGLGNFKICGVITGGSGLIIGGKNEC